MGFDGIDEVVLPAADLGPLLSLYEDVLGFERLHDEVDPDPGFAAVWSLPAPPSRTVLLGKPGSAGGWIRLAEVPGLPAPATVGRPDRSGAYALDFYVREPPVTEAALAAAGYPARAPAASYPLPGHPETLVHEGILDQPHSGLIHATIGYRAHGTRCVLDRDRREQVSEVVALVVSSRRYAEALSFVQEVLGGRRYLAGEFGGEPLEPLLMFEPGETLPMTLFRGPTSRNARLEICSARSPRPPRPDEPVPRVTATCRLDDFDEVVARLAGDTHGRSTGVLELGQDGASTRRLGLRTPYGLSLDLVDGR